MNGLLLIDKPEGLTSHDVVRTVRRACRTRRVGHAGTLDPMATGLLTVAVGEATRIVEFLMEGEKTYRASLLLGVETDTQDSSGQVTARQDRVECDETTIRRVMDSFIGEQQQIPPMYSALKKNGVALHRLARQGLVVEREARTIKIGRMEPIEIAPPRISFEVDCSKGTYVRTLCHDLGHKLGTFAHMTSLRRIRSGSFHVKDAVSLELIAQAAPESIEPYLLPLAEGLRDYSACRLSADAVRKLRHGIPPQISEIFSPTPLREGEIVVLKEQDRALAIGCYAPGRQREQRGDIELFKVFNTAAQ
ncbi:MAG: tRNA pseudouridine(55) synthase TruB [Syntrophotaleaceae bacterium]